MKNYIFSFIVCTLCIQVVFAGDKLYLTHQSSSQPNFLLGLTTGTATVTWPDGVSSIYSASNNDLTDSTSGIAYQLIKGDYSSSQEGKIEIDLSSGFSSVALLGTNWQSPRIEMDLKQIGNLTNLKALISQYGMSPTGNISYLPNKLEHLALSGYYGEIEGNIGDLPSSLKTINISSTVLKGDISDLPRNLTSFESLSGLELTGDIGDLPTGLEKLALNGYESTIQGSIKGLPSALKTINISSIALNGDVSDLPRNLTSLGVSDVNLSGYIYDLPANLDFLSIETRGTIQGNIKNLPENLESFLMYCESKCNLYGDIGYLPKSLQRFVLEYNRNTFISGNIASIPKSMRTFSVDGHNTIYGNIELLSNHSMLQTLQLLSGVDIQSGEGGNTLTGRIEYLPSSVSGIEITGKNTISGDFGLLKSNKLYYLNLKGNNRVNSFTLPASWSAKNLRQFSVSGSGGGFNINNLNNALKYLSENVGTGYSYSSIRMNRSSDASPGATAQKYIDTLKSKGFSVYTN